MNTCKKCGNNFEQKKGLVNYCSLECRNSRNWSDEDKKRKSIANKINFSEEDIEKLKIAYCKVKNLNKLSKLIGYDVRTIRKNIEIIKRDKQTPYDKIKNWRQKIKEQLIEYKGGKCFSCGYNKCTAALEFHHLAPEEKDFGIRHKIQSVEKIKKEVDKCALLCSNCHREVHAGLITLTINNAI